MMTSSISKKIFVALVAVCASVDAIPFNKRDGGRATFYDIGLGACGQWSSEPEFIVALNSAQYNQMGGGYPNPAVCGKEIEIKAFGKTAIARVMDECPTCGWGELDFSHSLFKHFASESDGVFDMEWFWVEAHPEPAPTPTTGAPPSPPSPTGQAPPPATSEAPATTTDSTVTPTETWTSSETASTSTQPSTESVSTTSSTSAGSTVASASTTTSESWATESPSRVVTAGWGDNDCWDCVTSTSAEWAPAETASTTTESEFTVAPAWIQVESSSITDPWVPAPTEDALPWNAWSVSGAARSKVPGTWALWLCLLVPAVVLAV